MIRKTEQNFGGQSLRQTMVQGLKALGGREVPNYTLLYLDPTVDKKRGDYQAIVVPYIEIGRGADCVIRYGDNYSTVSRKHASLSWEGNEIVLKHLGTNPTFVNNTPIHEKWFLKNGDEIQFSSDGPKIRFNATQSKTSTMKFTERFNEFSQQALRPYRKTIMALSLLLVGLSAFTIWSQFQNKAEIGQLNKEIGVLEDSLMMVNNGLKNNNTKNRSELLAVKQSLEARIRARRNTGTSIQSSSSALAPQTVSTANGIDPAAELAKFDDFIYYIHATKCEIILPGKSGKTFEIGRDEGFGFSGTGFLTSNGKFITARHVIQPWVFSPADYGYDCDKMGEISDLYIQLKNVIRSGGKVNISFVAISPNRSRFTFTSDMVTMDDSQDQLICDGSIKTILPKGYHSDWAFIRKENVSSPIELDNVTSKALKKGQTIYALGYTRGLHLQNWDEGELQPLYGGASLVSQNGLVNGLINVTNNGMDGGLSGGPLFTFSNGKWVAVGVVSGGYGNAQVGRIVPVSNIW